MDLDLNTLRSAATLLMFVLFLGICGWAWSRRRRGEFEDAAQLPFVDDLPASGRRSGEHP
jgi:cytochrome c oxidase cbb3-type subunit 4